MPGLAVIALPVVDDWHELIACRDANPDIFFPKAGDDATTARAKRFCARCPVTAQCLAEGDEYADPGIRGGLTTAERSRLRGKELVYGVGWLGLVADRKLTIEDIPLDMRVYQGMVDGERDDWALKLRVDGWTLREIAEALGCASHGGVNLMLDRARKGRG